MNKVYVLVDNPKQPLNFIKAERFGEIVTIFDHNVSPTYLRRCMPDLEAKLSNIKSGDYLIPVGPPALIAMAGYIWLSSVPKMNLLTWDREMQDYYIVTVEDSYADDN